MLFVLLGTILFAFSIRNHYFGLRNTKPLQKRRYRTKNNFSRFIMMYILINADLLPTLRGCTLYQGYILAERQQNWSRMAQQALHFTEENRDDMKSAMLRIERGKVGMYGDQKVDMVV